VYCRKGVPEEAQLLELGWMTKEVVVLYLVCERCGERGCHVEDNRGQGVILLGDNARGMLSDVSRFPSKSHHLSDHILTLSCLPFCVILCEPYESNIGLCGNICQVL